MAGIVTASQMLKHGLTLVGIDEQTQSRRLRSTCISDFKAHFGAHPVHCAFTWRDLLTCEQTCPEAYIAPANAEIDAFFYGLHFLRLYQSESVRAARFGVGKQTVREKSWFYVTKIAALKHVKIVLPDAWDTTYTLSLDGAHFAINEPRHPTLRRDEKNYSHKYNAAGVDYEVGVALFQSKIVWIKGPVQASTHDHKVFQSELQALIPAGKRIIVDNGYQGCPEFYSNYNQFDTEEVREFKKRAKSRQEAVNGKMKVFKVLDSRFGHPSRDFVKHGLCFDAVAVLTQYAIEDTGRHGCPLFEI